MHKPTVDPLNHRTALNGGLPSPGIGAPQRPPAGDTLSRLHAGHAGNEELGPLVGQVFGGYEIVSYIGEGPAGAVYRGEDLLGNAMAVKVLHPGLADRERTGRLRAELLTLSGLGTPLLQTIYDTGYGERGQFYYVTDELIGCDLETGLDDSGGLTPAKSYEIVRAALQALDVAHGAGVIHGGLRPRNIFLIPAHRGTSVKVLDFGAARLGAGDRHIVAGLPAYLAPEQLLRGGDGATAKSDLYALGVLMYELFSGSPPAFRGGAQAALGGRRGPVVPPGGVVGDDPRLQRLIVSLLENDPARRPASAAITLAELDGWAASAHRMLDPTQRAVVRRRGPSALSGSIGPDSTLRMSKFDAIALAQETLPATTQAPHADAVPMEANHVVPDSLVFDTGRIEPVDPDPLDHGSDSDKTRVAPARAVTKTRTSEKPNVLESRRTMTQDPSSNPPPKAPAEPDANASESVEASLEDFISQANANFPAADGWDLHTGDVELVEDEATGAPIAQVRSSATALPATELAATPARGLPLGGVRPPHGITEHTEVVSSYAAPPTTSWTHNPLLVGSMLLGSVVVGAGVMFMAIRTMIPQQPQVIVAPAPVAPAVAAPVVAAPPAAPVVTPLAPTPTAAAPVVTPLPPAAQVEPAPRATEPAPRAAAPAKKAAPPRKAAAKHEAAPAPKREAAAAAPKKEDKPTKKKGGSSGDWVDPFAN